MATDSGGVLITGGTGFAGSYVARTLLDRGRQVALFDLRPLSAEARFVLGQHADRVHVDLGSIDNAARVFEVVKTRQPEQIVHIAGILDVDYLWKNPWPAVHTSVAGTLNVLEAAKLFGVGRIVNFSTIGVIARVMYEPIDGNHPVLLAREGPMGAYSAAKVSQEAFCYAYQQAFGLDTRTIRPSALYGFGMSPLASNLMKEFVEPAVRGERAHIPSGGPVPRDYVHAQDLAGLTAAVLDGPDDADRIFYAATGEPLVTASRVVEIVRELIPGADIDVADILSEEDELYLGCRGLISIENARAQLGWTPTFGNVRDGIAEYIERYRAFLGADSR